MHGLADSINGTAYTSKQGKAAPLGGRVFRRGDDERAAEQRDRLIFQAAGQKRVSADFLST